MAGKLALVLSGGGAKGAFQVGVLDELIGRRGIRFDIVVGVSTGALQALAVAQDDVAVMLAEWLGIRKDSDIYKKRPLGALGGFLGGDAIYNAKPLRKILERVADENKLKRTGIALRVGVASLGTGVFRAVDENAPRIHDWVYASCAMPVFFDPLETVDPNGAKEQWVDGGVRDVTPLGTALDAGARAVLVVRASPPPKPAPNRTYSDLIKIGLRAVDILQSEVSANDTATASLINDLLAARDAQAKALSDAGIGGDTAKRIMKPFNDQIDKYRFAPIHVIEPEIEYSETLEFDPAKIRAAIAAGRQAAADHFPAVQALAAQAR